MQTKFLMSLPASGFLMCCLSTAAFAQLGAPGLGGGGTPSTSALSASPDQGSAGGSVSSQGRAWVIRPRISLTETLTDNSNVNGSANNKQNELITQISPGVRVEASSARLKGYLDYALNSQYYAKEPDNNRNQNSLNASGTFEAIDKWLFLDFSGVIAQQSISAFGPQSTSNTTINSNSTETATYRLSPYIRGQLAGTAEYSLRYSLSTTRSDAGSTSNVDLSQWVGQLRGSTPFQKLRWTVDGNQQTTDYSNGRKSDSELVRGIATYTVLPQFRVSLSGGWESNNYASEEQQSRTTHGYGFDWNPTERTKFSVFRERRFFGNGHNINLSHRFPMSSITFTDTKNVSVLPNQFANTSLSARYPQFALLCAQQYTDPLQIDSCILNLLGSQANTQLGSGFLSSRPTIQRNQQLALALSGARNTLTLAANRSESQSISGSTALNDDLSQNSSIKQQGLSVNLSHRLSELTNLNFLASRQESTGSSSTNLKATTTLYQINLSTKLGAKTSGSLSARRSEFDSTTTPYTENALVGTVSYIY